MIEYNKRNIINDLHMPIGYKAKDITGNFIKLGMTGYQDLNDLIIAILFFFLILFRGIFLELVLRFIHLENLLPGPYKSLLSSIIPLCAVYFVVTRYHKRPFYTVLSGEGRFRWKLFLRSLTVFGILNILIFLLLSPLSQMTYYWSFNLTKWFIQLLPVLILVLIQTGAEEIIFRGYLQQCFGRFRFSKIYAVIISSLIFGLLHLPNVSHFGGHWWLAFYYFLIAVFWALITIKSNGIEKALGVHFIINFIGLTVLVPNNQVIQGFNAIFEITYTTNLINTLAIPALVMIAYYVVEFQVLKPKILTM